MPEQYCNQEISSASIEMGASCFFRKEALPAPLFCISHTKNLQKSSFFVTQLQTPFQKPCYTPSMTANQQPIGSSRRSAAKAEGHDITSAGVGTTRPRQRTMSVMPLAGRVSRGVPRHLTGFRQIKANQDQSSLFKVNQGQKNLGGTNRHQKTGISCPSAIGNLLSFPALEQFMCPISIGINP